MPAMYFDWTEERIATLREMRAAGASYTEAAAKLGCSRNAAIGQGHRLKLPGQNNISAGMRRSHENKRERRIPRRHTSGLAFKIANGTFGQRGKVKLAPQPRKPVEPPVDVPVPVSRRLTIMELTAFTCKYPDGTRLTRAETYCGHVPEPGRPYCTYHRRIAYQPPEPRRVRNLERLARVVG